MFTTACPRICSQLITSAHYIFRLGSQKHHFCVSYQRGFQTLSKGCEFVTSKCHTIDTTSAILKIAAVVCGDRKRLLLVLKSVYILGTISASINSSLCVFPVSSGQKNAVLTMRQILVVFRSSSINCSGA